MREIKFRAWDKKTKKIRAVNSIAFHYEHEAFDFDPSRLPKVVNVWGRDMIEDKDIILHREEKDVILMQYTGLKDKNGVEIYEGDIVEHNGYVGSVYYNSDEVSFFLKNTVENEDEAYLPNESRVIGNIYENPELLEAK